MRCFKIVEYIKTADMTPLTDFNTILLSKKDIIIDDWLSSHRMTDLITALGITLSIFRKKYAEFIFEFFYTYTTDKTQSEACPTAKRFLNDFKDIDDVVQIIVLICTEFKNKITKQIFCCSLEYDKKEVIFNIFSDLLDTNLSLILSEYSDYVLSNIRFEKNKIAVLEAESIIAKTDTNGVILEVSERLCNILGYSKSELIGNTFKIIRHPDVPTKFYKRMWETLRQGNIWSDRIKNLNSRGETIVFETKIIPTIGFDGSIVGYTSIKTDLTDKINIQLDSLTGILNRKSFDKRLSIACENRYYSKPTLIMIDLDNFKDVNDVHGHLAGDTILKEFTTLVSDTIRPTDTFARWGGEEFAIILPETNIVTALEITERLRKLIENYKFSYELKKTASFGVCELCNDCNTPNLFIGKADLALYEAKKTRNSICYIDNKGNMNIYKPKS